MYNIFKNKIYSSIYLDYIRDKYLLISESDNKEEVYYRNNKLVIAVNDTNIGTRLYELLKVLKDSGETISTQKATFKIHDFAFDKNKTVKWFCIEIHYNSSSYFLDWRKNYSCEGNLREIIYIVEELEKIGWVLDKTNVNLLAQESISEFLASFIKADDDNENSHECMLKYIHSVFSNGTELKEFYESIAKEKLVIADKFPYSLAIVKLCYNYYKTGVISDDIYRILQEELFKECDDYYIIALEEDFDSKFNISEKNVDYTVYNGEFKIIHEITADYETFLRAKDFFMHYGDVSIEVLHKVIINLDGNVIGYTFENYDFQNSHNIFDIELKTQKDVIDFSITIFQYLNIYNQLSESGMDNDFDIESSVTLDNLTFRINTLKDLFKLIKNNHDFLKTKFTSVFFKIFLQYITKKYGELKTEEQFFEKIDIRALNPIVAREFINFALNRQPDIDFATQELIDFIQNKKENAELYYDTRFEYDPTHVPYILDQEVKNKYGVELKKGTSEHLPDGRLLVTFKRCVHYFGFQEKEAEKRKVINGIQDRYIRIVGISEIIYSSKLNSDNMYNIAGYITKPIKGNVLTDQLLLSLNNKELYKIAGYLFSSFSKFSISFDSIWVYKNQQFYINIFDENFKVEKIKNSEKTYIERVFMDLLQKGYNPNAFVGLDFQKTLEYSSKRAYFLNLASSCKAYCEEHKIYFCNDHIKYCPVCAKTKYTVRDYFLARARVIFEDSISKNYNINDTYNLKKYKDSVDDISEIEKNIDKNLVNSLISMELDYHQDCFVPIKKAVNENKEFIGYMYPATCFEKDPLSNDVCIDLEDYKKLENLPRLKSLVRLLLQVKELVSQNIGFIKNPFEHVFLNLAHKKQVQISNAEFLCEGNVKDTIAWTCDYVYKILEQDDSIQINIEVEKSLEDMLNELPESPSAYDLNSLDNLLGFLNTLSAKLTKYCSLHQMYYHNDYIFCPKCLDKEIMKSIEIVYDSISNYPDTNPNLGQGGESYIYPYTDGTVVKVFKKTVDFNFKYLILAKIFGRKSILEKINSQGYKFKYVIPQKIHIDKDSNKIFAYSMEKIENAMSISSLSDTGVIKKFGFTKKDVFEILITIGEGLEYLHKEANIFIGDLNGENILFDAQKNVYFLDFDGVGVDDISPAFCTEKYIDPVSKDNQNITMKDDWYSYSVQVFHYLTYTHPFNGIYRVYQNGRLVNLKIEDRMRQRISVLGDHGVKLPSVADSWDWMIPKLKAAFLDTFEGNLRQSIVSLLKEQYETLFSEDFSSQQVNKIYRINSKFIAEELMVFDGKVIRVINHYSAICEKDSKLYIAIVLGKQNVQKNICISDCESVKRVLLSEDEKTVFIIFSKTLYAFDLTSVTVNSIAYNVTDTSIYSGKIVNARNVYVDNNTLYYLTIIENSRVISVKDFSNENAKEYPIDLGKKVVKHFFVKNSKFIIIKKMNDSVDEIYCNSEKFCNISHTGKVKYHTVYDANTKSWLVINSEGRGIIIQANGKSININIPEYISEKNYINFCFNNGIIYIPHTETLNILKWKVKKIMECGKYINEESILYNIDQDGFSVITDNVLYRIRKG